ncbi:MAG: efflux RND transporter periplasmic adaptor subunit [Planctomycetota bacterium]
MSAQEGLASLRIDRTQSRSGSWVGKLVWIAALVILIVLAVTVGPKWPESYFGVEVSTAKVSYLDSGKGELSAAGYVVADRMSVLAFKGTGRLEKLYVVESQPVKLNEVIAEIDHRELDAVIEQTKADIEESKADVKRLEALTFQAAAGAANSKAEIAAAKEPLVTLEFEVKEIRVKLADAQRRYDRDKKLAESNAMALATVEDHLTEIRLAEAQIATLQQKRQEILKRIAVAETQAAMADSQVATAKSAVAVSERHVLSMTARIGVFNAQLQDARIFSPFDGVVIEKAAEVGEIVAPISIGGSMARGSIATIAERKTLQAEVDVAEQFIAKVKVGQRASILIDAFPEMPLAGKVLRILPRANRGKATVQVRVGINDILQHEEIRPDMGLRVKFLADDAPANAETVIVKKLAVPKAALVTGGTRVWVVQDGIATEAKVETGETKGDLIEIKSGVKEGQSVAVKGAEMIKTDKQKVRLTE